MIQYGMLRKGMYAAAFLLLASNCCRAQLASDTLHLSWQGAEQRFLSKNLSLLAAHYGVRADSALIRQARLWDNPTLNVDQNVYVPGDGFFRHGEDAQGNSRGQVYVQVQQLIQLGGKRRNAVSMAGVQAGVSQLQFDEMLNSLRRSLKEDLLQAGQLHQNTLLFQEVLEKLNVLERGISGQYEAGNVSRKDLLRVQGLVENMRMDLADNVRAVEALQTELRVLLNLQGDTLILPDKDLLQEPVQMPAQNLDELLLLAQQNNPSYLIAEKQLDYQKLNYRYQRALAVPDLEVGPNYDRASNFAPNYFGLSLSLPLPLWNRNQGNIRAAAFQTQQQQASTDEARLNLESSLRSAYRNLQTSVNLASPQQNSFYQDYRLLFDKVAESYRARQISLIEFIDYLDSYVDIQSKQRQQQLNLQLAKEALNYVVGLDIVK
ncbi:MAG: TolC family protein [Bacteroidetes bacterium]|nr:TolC family protein [Bacteroidota bacterium]MBS1630336.1 TolC family protein [Bacteroidota bacterium]